MVSLELSQKLVLTLRHQEHREVWMMVKQDRRILSTSSFLSALSG